jgi:hypothetical protein
MFSTSRHTVSCKFYLQRPLFTNPITAPAAKAVEYQTVKFNNTMGEGSPYVGKGPEVDKAWHAISYDSKFFATKDSFQEYVAEISQSETK